METIFTISILLIFTGVIARIYFYVQSFFMETLPVEDQKPEEPFDQLKR